MKKIIKELMTKCYFIGNDELLTEIKNINIPISKEILEEMINKIRG